MEIQYWYWVVFGIILMASEIVLTSFIILWFGLAAVIVGLILLAAPTLSIEWQILIWTVLSASIAFLWFKFIKPLSIDKTQAGLGKEALFGQVGLVLQAPNQAQRGLLRLPAPLLGNDEWQFLIKDESVLSPGDRVKIIDISGNTLVVNKL